jgi:hypothetical protein
MCHLSVLGRKTPPRRGLEHVSLANTFAVIEKIHRGELCDVLRLLCDLRGQGPVAVVDDVVAGRPSCAHGLESDVQLFWRRHCKVEFFKADHSAGVVFDQDHLVTGFLTDVFTFWITEPDGQRIASPIVKDFYLLHIRTFYLSQLPSREHPRCGSQQGLQVGHDFIIPLL